MICPHCKKPITKEHSTKLRQEVLKLHREGYSARDIEALTYRAVSFSTAARWVREQSPMRHARALLKDK